MALTPEQLEQQKKQAEELLFSGPQTLGFAKGLFFGHFNAPLVFPYPQIKPEERETVDKAVAELRRFADAQLDPMAVDRNAEIPPEVISGLGKLGVLGMTAPKEYGGRGLSQLGNCRILEEIGSRCSATAIFVNAHQSIGIRALLLFGTEEQKRRWLPTLCTGEKMAAFALTMRSLAVSAGYCIYNAYRMAMLRRDRILRDRVAYMLWMAAGDDE
jgi:hypothetical protein